MRRREVIASIGATAGTGAWPLPTLSQRSEKPIVGVISSGGIDGYRNLMIAFRKGLAETGFVDGQSVSVVDRWAEGQFDRLPVMTKELIQMGATVIMATGIASALGVRRASANIPLVFLAGDDPVRFGLVASLNRPGGQATGVAWLTSELVTKRLDLVRALKPSATHIGLLANPRSPESASQTKLLEGAVRTNRLTLRIAHASSLAEFEPAFGTLAHSRVDVLLVSTDPLFNVQRELITGLAARHRIPAIYDRREFAIAGGLMSYGTSYSAAYRTLGHYAGKILGGTRPGDLPIEQAMRFEQVINLKTAAALGIAIPDQLLALTDEVIE